MLPAPNPLPLIYHSVSRHNRILQCNAPALTSLYNMNMKNLFVCYTDLRAVYKWVCIHKQCGHKEICNEKTSDVKSPEMDSCWMPAFIAQNSNPRFFIAETRVLLHKRAIFSSSSPHLSLINCRVPSSKTCSYHSSFKSIRCDVVTTQEYQMCYQMW